MMSVFKKLLNKSVNGRLRDGLATSPDRILSLCLSIAAALCDNSRAIQCDKGESWMITGKCSGVSLLGVLD